MCMTDYDPPEFYLATIRGARKLHDCEECGREIQPGEPYQYVSGKWDGSFNCYKTCQHCIVTQKWLSDNCHGFVHSMTEEDIREHASDYDRFDLYRLAVGMKNQWRTRKGRMLPVPKLPRPLHERDATHLAMH